MSDDPKQTAGSDEAPQTAPESFDVKQEDKAWFENLLDEAKGRPLTAEENQKLAEKFKGYDRGISKYRSDLDRQRASLESREKEVLRVMDELKEARTAKEQSSILKGTSSEVRDLIEEAIDRTEDPNGRETLRWLDKALKQRLSKMDQLEKDITELRQSFQGVSRTALMTREQSLVSEIKELEKRYGDSVADKYRDAIIQYGTQYPNYSARRLLHMIADPDEIEQAVELQGRKTKQSVPATNGARSSSAPVATSPQHPSEKFRGKSPAQIKQGMSDALDEVMTQGLAKIKGLGGS